MCECVRVIMTGMYSLYHPVLADTPSSATSSSSSAGVGYQVLAAASDGHLTLTEITPKLDRAARYDSGQLTLERAAATECEGELTLAEITPKLERRDEDEDDVTVSAPEFCEVSTTELAVTNLDMIVECASTT